LIFYAFAARPAILFPAIVIALLFTAIVAALVWIGRYYDVDLLRYGDAYARACEMGQAADADLADVVAGLLRLE